MTAAVTKREALRWLGAVALAAGSPLAIPACTLSDAELEALLREALVELGGLAGGVTVGETAALSPAQAFAKLRGDASGVALWVATSNRVALRRWLARRREDDLRAGRTRWVRGWLLTETEIAVAALISR